MKSVRILFIAAVVLLPAAGCHLSIERDVYVDSGRRVNHSINVIDGNITIGSNCDVRANCRVVDGDIEVGHDSEVRTLQLVDGQIRVESDVLVDGDLQLVDGEVVCSRGVEVKGDIHTVDGTIEVDRTLVQHDVTTYAADISLLNGSRVKGDIVIKRSDDRDGHYRRIRIEIAGGSIVEGDIRVRDEDADVVIYLREGGRIEGRVINAEVIRR